MYSLENDDAQPEPQEGSLKPGSSECDSSTSNAKNPDGDRASK